jgi:hypothetical protein
MEGRGRASATHNSQDYLEHFKRGISFQRRNKTASSAALGYLAMLINRVTIRRRASSREFLFIHGILDLRSIGVKLSMVLKSSVELLSPGTETERNFDNGMARRRRVKYNFTSEIAKSSCRVSIMYRIMLLSSLCFSAFPNNTE